MLSRLLNKIRTYRRGEGEAYRYRTKDDRLSFEEQAEQLTEKLKGQHTVIPGWPTITYSAVENQKLLDSLSALDDRINIKNFRVNLADYEIYLQRVGYQEKYPRYYDFNFAEKTLEHYIAFKLLDLKRGERFIDIAAENSPHSKEFSLLAGCTGYQQDIMYPPGIHDKKIGGDASSLPVPDGFFQAALAACSLEHFEKEADIRFMQEMTRVLSPHGKVVILPLYLHERPFCATDPRCAIAGEVVFDPGIDVHLLREFNNRHGRFYSPKTVYERLIRPNLEGLDFTLYYIENFRDIDPSVYCRFALLGQKK